MLLCASLLVAGCASEEQAAEPGGGGGEQAVPVEVATVRAETLEETVRGIGSLESPDAVILRPETSGVVREIGFEEGAHIEEGALLFRIDEAILESELGAQRATLRSARARLQNAERRFERQEALLQRGVSAQAAYDDALADKDSAAAEVARLRAEVALTKERIRDTRIEAPFSGVISERRIDRGAWVQTGQDLATLYRTGALEVGFTVPERYAGRIAVGRPVRVSVESRPDTTWEGEVSYVSPSIDEANRDLRVKAQVPVAEGLRPGSFVTARVVLDVRRDVPVVPEEALVGTRKGYIVFAVREGRAHRVSVETGLREPGIVEIREGVEAGDRVVREGHMRLSDGARVQPQTDEAGEADADAGQAPPPEDATP
ncbi:MAG: efflux RND transporter periplasmic adaptor subunit [Myxococcota bacterium]